MALAGMKRGAVTAQRPICQTPLKASAIPNSHSLPHFPSTLDIT